MYPFYNPQFVKLAHAGARGAGSRPQRSGPDLRGGCHGNDRDLLPRSLSFRRKPAKPTTTRRSSTSAARST